MKETCTNCESELKSSFMNKVSKTDDRFNKIVNEILNLNVSYCTNCSHTVQLKSDTYLIDKQVEYRNEFSEKIKSIPVITLQNPKDWNYKPLSMVTSQSVTGTGVFTEISSSITDLLGGQSDRLNSKIRQGENICVNQLRLSCFNIGGNAVIATDIDYAELGGGKGMIMVCMSGTAIKLENPEILSNDFAEDINRLSELISLEKELNRQQLELKSAWTYSS